MQLSEVDRKLLEGRGTQEEEDLDTYFFVTLNGKRVQVDGAVAAAMRRRLLQLQATDPGNTSIITMQDLLTETVIHLQARDRNSGNLVAKGLMEIKNFKRAK